MNVPESMKAELAAWNNGAGIDLESADRAGGESVMNHWHLDGIQYVGCPDATPDKLLRLGRTLEQIYTAKLQWQFPERPCRVSLHVPDDPLLLNQYEITFWQVANEHVPA